MPQSINNDEDDNEAGENLLDHLPSEFRYPYITARDILLPPFRAKFSERNIPQLDCT